MSRKFDVIIVGAGASGLTAGIQAARKGAQVLILEHMDQAGKKILATGNGKCNFTNEKQGIAYYNGKNPAFVLPAFGQFGLEETLRFFRELGIYPRSKRGGYYYPSSGQASSVLEVLLMECKRQKEKKDFSFTRNKEFSKATAAFLPQVGNLPRKQEVMGAGSHIL